MFVVAILGIMVGLAIAVFTRTKNEGDLDRFALDVREMMTRARRRAVATHSNFVVDVRATSIAYCQQDPANLAQNTCPTASTAVCTSGAGTGPCESSRAFTAGPEATVLQTAKFADAAGGSGPAPTAIGAGTAVYFLPTGAADSDLATATPDGFTVYLQGLVDTFRHRKIVLFPAGAKPQVIDSW
jgi:Tfp pilus assembly protein FimT